MNRHNTRASVVRQMLLSGFVLVGMLGLSTPVTGAMFERGFYLGVGYGEYGQDSNIDAPSSSGNKLTRIFLGYSLSDWLSAEAGYADLSTIRYESIDLEVKPKSGYARANLQIPLYREDQTMVAFSLSGGVHHWDAKETSAGVQQRFKGNSPLYGAGVLLRSRDTALRLEYEIFSGIDDNFEIDAQVWSANLLFYF